jgi:hypothetical protein
VQREHIFVHGAFAAVGRERERQEGLLTWACRGCILILVLVVSSFPSGAPARASSMVLTGPSPDLAPSEMELTPNEAHEGDFLRVKVTLENRGDLAAWSAMVQLFDRRPDGETFLVAERGLARSLGPDASVVITMPPFIAAGVGRHTLTARVVDVVPTDENPANDLLSFQMTVLESDEDPGPGPPADGIQAEALETAGLAGLIVIVVLSLLGLAVTLAGRGRRGESLVPPPPEPPDERPPPIWPP